MSVAQLNLSVCCLRIPPKPASYPTTATLTPNFSFLPCSEFAWIVAGSLFKVATLREAKRIWGLSGKVQYYFYPNEVGTKRYGIIGPKGSGSLQPGLWKDCPADPHWNRREVSHLYTQLLHFKRSRGPQALIFPDVDLSSFLKEKLIREERWNTRKSRGFK